MWSRLSLLVFVLMLGFSPFVYAEEKKETPSIPCDQNYSIGSVFYDFDAIIIFYAGDFMLKSAPLDPEFPASLHDDAFNSRLVKALKKNFSLCLKTKDGGEKPIYSAFPQRNGALLCEGDANCGVKLENWGAVEDMIHNPRYLTLVVRGKYDPQWKVSADIKGSGVIFVYWYRPGLEYKQASIPRPNNSDFRALPPLKGQVTIEDTLDDVFSYLAPIRLPKLDERFMYAYPIHIIE